MRDASQIAQFLRAYHLGSHRPPPLLRPPAPYPSEYAFGSTATLLEPDLPEDTAAAEHIRAKLRLSASIAGRRAAGESPIVSVDSSSTAGLRYLPQALGQVSRGGASLDPGSSFKPHASDLAGVAADDLFREEPIDMRKQRSEAKRSKTSKKRRRGKRKPRVKGADASPGPARDSQQWLQRVGPGPPSSAPVTAGGSPAGSAAAGGGDGLAAGYTTEADKDGDLLKRSLTVAAALLAPLRPEAHREVTVEDSAWWESNVNKHRRREVEQRKREDEKAAAQELVVTWGEDSAARWAWIQFPWFAMCNVLRGAGATHISGEEAERLLWDDQEQRMWEKTKCVHSAVPPPPCNCLTHCPSSLRGGRPAEKSVRPPGPVSRHKRKGRETAMRRKSLLHMPVPGGSQHAASAPTLALGRTSSSLKLPHVKRDLSERDPAPSPIRAPRVAGVDKGDAVDAMQSPFEVRARH